VAGTPTRAGWSPHNRAVQARGAVDQSARGHHSTTGKQTSVTQWLGSGSCVGETR